MRLTFLTAGGLKWRITLSNLLCPEPFMTVGISVEKLWFLDSLNRPGIPGGFVIRPQKL